MSEDHGHDRQRGQCCACDELQIVTQAAVGVLPISESPAPGMPEEVLAAQRAAAKYLESLFTERTLDRGPRSACGDDVDRRLGELPPLRWPGGSS